MRDHLNTNVYDVKRSQIREYANLAANTPGCISLTLGEPDFDTPKSVVDQVAVSFSNHETHYINNAGSIELRAKIAEFEKKNYSMDYSTDEILVTCGATEAIFTALFGVCCPGDEVIIFTPAFGLYEEVVKLAGAKAVFLDTSIDDFQIDKAKLESIITDKTKAMIINTPNNPTGCILSEASLQAIHDVVCNRPIFVLCDDVYRQLIYTDNYHSFTEFRDLREQIIVIQSFSKPYAMTGWRMGYLMCDYPVKERLELVHQYIITSTPGPFQRACIEALDFDPEVFRLEYLRRRDYVLDRLSKMGLKVNIPDGAFYVFPSIKELGLSSDEFCRRLINEEKLALTPGACFGSEGNVRISYCASDETLEKGMDRLEAFVNKLGK